MSAAFMDVPLRRVNLDVRQYNVPFAWTGVANTAKTVCSKLIFVGLHMKWTT